MIKQNKYLQALDLVLPTEEKVKMRKSRYFIKIKNINDLLRDVALRNKCFSIIDWDSSYEPSRGRFITIGVDEENNEVLLLMEELGLIKVDWKSIEKLSHRKIGHRNIEVAYGVDKFFELLDKINGKNGIIRKQTLEFIAEYFEQQNNGNNIMKLLQRLGVPVSLVVYPIHFYNLIDTVLTYYASSSMSKDHQMLFRIIEESTHSLMFKGDKEKSLETQDLFSDCLQFDGFCFSKGKIVKTTNKLLTEINKRQKERKDNKHFDKINNISKIISASNKENLIQNEVVENIQNNIKPKIEFDTMNGVLYYGKVTHKFHRGLKGEERRLLLVKKLWEERKHFIKGKEKHKGGLLSPEFLAVQLGITSNAQDFSRNKNAKNNLFGLVKGINRTLSKKRFPIKIERKNGLQIVITEK